MTVRSSSSTPLRRAAANAGRLLTGKAAAGLMQLATFALAARALGAGEFGVLSVLTAQAMVFTTLATFESNQAIISYGAPRLEEGDLRGLSDLFWAGTRLDIGAAAIAAVLIAIAAHPIGHLLGWNARTIALAWLVVPLPLANAIGTPKGMLRLFGRFDLLSIHVTVTPAARLILIAVLALLEAPLAAYLIAWVVAGLIGAAVGTWLGWREARRCGVRSRHGNDRVPIPGLWRFSLFSNLNSSLALVPGQLATIIVAWQLGDAAAGLFRVAREVGTGVLKPVDLVGQALYPDLARLVAAREWVTVRVTAIRAGLMASGIGFGLTLFLLIAGTPLINLVFGSTFNGAAPLLVLIGLGTTIRVVTFAAEPIMFALGRADRPFVITAVTSLLFLGVLMWRLPLDGLRAAGLAFVAMGVTGTVAAGLVAARMIAGATRAPIENQVAEVRKKR